MPQGAWSVHLRYQAPLTVTAFYNEVMVLESAPRSFYVACGFQRCYLGFREGLAAEDRNILFSVWDAAGKDSEGISGVGRAEAWYAADDVVLNRFGGEGTGYQVSYPFNWQIGGQYRFLLTMAYEREMVSYTAYCFLNESAQWKRLATLRAHAGSFLGPYSFVEDVLRDGGSFHQRRNASFVNGWMRLANGLWLQLTTAEFTAAGTQSGNIDAGVLEDGFSLVTGGQTIQHTKAKTILERPILPDRNPPEW